MNPLLKFINKSVIQPINKVQKGIHNLSLYRAYVKNPKNFANSVNESLQHYSVRYPVLQSNYFARDLHGPFILNPYRVKLDMPDVSIGFKFNSPLGSFSSDNKIILYPYTMGGLMKAWRNPKKAIYYMQGVAAHEGAHAALHQIGVNLSEYSPKTKYWVANKNGLAYDDLTYAFDSRKRNWTKSPEEFVADMSYCRTRTNSKPGYGFSQWSPKAQQQTINYLSKEFGFTPEDTRYMLNQFSQLGFKLGGVIPK